jgi:predicted amidophosphoribosyltransferase
LSGDGFVTCEKCRRVRGKQKSEAMKAKRLAWKAAGKCQECGKRWAEAGKTLCKPCLKALKERQKRNDPDNAKKYARRQARVDKGLCIDCGRKTEPGKKRCDRCRKMRRESEEKYRLKKKLAREAQKRGRIQDGV